jgi:hypothetical protein
MLETDIIGLDVTNSKALLKSPTVLRKEQAKMQYGEYGLYNKLSNRLGYIYAYNGRPDWDGILAAVREARLKGVNQVGVCYCGAPNIGDELKTNCAKFTGSGPGCTFTLNKEVF